MKNLLRIQYLPPSLSYVNQKLNEMIAGFVTMETETTYNRGLEKEVLLLYSYFEDYTPMLISHLILGGPSGSYANGESRIRPKDCTDCLVKGMGLLFLIVKLSRY